MTLTHALWLLLGGYVGGTLLVNASGRGWPVEVVRDEETANRVASELIGR